MKAKTSNDLLKTIKTNEKYIEDQRVKGEAWCHYPLIEEAIHNAEKQIQDCQSALDKLQDKK